MSSSTRPFLNFGTFSLSLSQSRVSSTLVAQLVRDRRKRQKESSALTGPCQALFQFEISTLSTAIATQTAECTAECSAKHCGYWSPVLSAHYCTRGLQSCAEYSALHSDCRLRPGFSAQSFAQTAVTSASHRPPAGRLAGWITAGTGISENSTVFRCLRTGISENSAVSRCLQPASAERAGAILPPRIRVVAVLERFSPHCPP